MKILVTGATGFIGNHVIEKLLQTGHEIIATSTNTDNARKFNWFPGVKFKEYDINEGVGLNLFEYFERPDLLIHLAWQGLPNYKELFHLEKNLFAQFTFLRNLIREGLNDLAVSGTCLEYGMQNGPLHESLPALPDNPYALAKDSLRKFIGALQREKQFCFKWIRLFYMYGEGQNPKSLLAQLETAIQKGDKEFNMSGGEQLRDYLNVNEVSNIICAIALQREVSGIINCCSGTPISIRNLVEQYLAEHNITIKLKLGYYPYTDYEPMSFWGDNTKLNKILK